MKRIIIIALSLLMFCGAASAQEKGRWQVELGAGFYGLDHFGLGGIFSSEIVMSQSSLRVGGDNYEMSIKYAPAVYPTLMLIAGYDIPETMIGVFLGTYWNYAVNYNNGGPSIFTERENIFHFIPEVRFYYYKTDTRRFYASVGAGMRYRHFTETFNGSTVGNSDVRFSFEICPLGASFGRNWIASVNIGQGSPWMLVGVSTGYRF